MQFTVYDTYVDKEAWKTMHFGVVVESSTPHDKAIEYGKKYPVKQPVRMDKNDAGRIAILPCAIST